MKKLFIILFSLLSISYQAFSQPDHRSYDDNTGYWNDPGTWELGDGSVGIGDDVEIYGTVLRDGNLTFNVNVVVDIYDTLIISGNLIFNIASDVHIHPGGLLIVMGNFMGVLSLAENEGDMIVGGQFNMGLSYFDTENGNTYLYDDDPVLGIGVGDPLTEDDIPPDLLDYYEETTCSMNDTEAPVISGCPSDQNVIMDAGACGAVITFSDPTADDACEGSIPVVRTDGTGLNSGDLFPAGVTTISWSATDGSGNSATCSFTVTVAADAESPVISGCPADQNVPMDPGVCGAAITFTNPTANDNCDGAVVPVRTDGTGLNSGDLFPAGVTTISWSATDVAGNASVCSFTVTVSDNEAPTITSCPGNITVNAAPGTCSAQVTYSLPTFEDICDGSGLTGNLVQGLPSGSYFPVGSTTVRYEYYDLSGNGPAVCEFTVTVNDSELPDIVCPANIMQCADDASGAIVNGLQPVSISDNCTPPGNLNLSYTLSGATGGSGTGDASGEFFFIGITTIEYTVTDESTNSQSCSFTVTVNPLPVTSDISGNATPNCSASGEIYSVTGWPDSRYLWIVPDEATIVSDTTGLGKTSIEVNFGSTSDVISVTEISSEGCAGETKTLSISLLGCELIADFTMDASSICLDDTVTYWSTSSGVSGSSTYAWDFGTDASPATAAGPGPHEVSYSSPGIKSVELSVTEGTTDVITKNVTVLEPPYIELTAEDICGAGSLVFTATTTTGNAVLFSDDGGNSILATDNTAPFEYSVDISDGETYTLWAKAINTVTGCEGEWSEGITAGSNLIPVTGEIIPDSPGVSYFDEVCAEGPSSYSITSIEGSSHTWDIPALGLHETGTDQINVNWDIAEGEYIIRVQQITDEGCAGTIREEIIYVSDPQVDLGSDQDICEGVHYLFEPEGNFSSYTW